MQTAKPQKRVTSVYTSVVTRERLLQLCETTGENQSELISRLVNEEYTYRGELKQKFQG